MKVSLVLSDSWDVRAAIHLPVTHRSARVESAQQGHQSRETRPGNRGSFADRSSAKVAYVGMPGSRFKTARIACAISFFP